MTLDAWLGGQSVLLFHHTHGFGLPVYNDPMGVVGSLLPAWRSCARARCRCLVSLESDWDIEVGQEKQLTCLRLRKVSFPAGQGTVTIDPLL